MTERHSSGTLLVIPTTNMSKNKNNKDIYDSSAFAGMTFMVNGEEMNLKEFVNHMNNALSSDDPHDFLPVVGPLDKAQTLVLVELTAAGLLSPSYSAYGYILINTLCENKKQVHQLYANGVDLFEKNHDIKVVESDEIILLTEENNKVTKKTIKKKNNKNNNK